jgi:hypothetical protein
MYRRKIVFTLLLAVALLIAQSLTFTNAGQALAQQLHEVLVVNTSANPVPVALQGTPNVGLDPQHSIVRVATSLIDPLEIRDVSDGVKAVVQASADVTIVDGATNGLAAIYTVPEGKRLVIEHVSASGSIESPSVPDRNMLFAIETVAGGKSKWHALITSKDGAFSVVVSPEESTTFVYFTASQPMRLYADPGTKVYFHVSRSYIYGPMASAGMTISGYLVDILPSRS